MLRTVGIVLASLALGCVQLQLGTGRRGELAPDVVYGEGGPPILLLEVEDVLVETERAGAFGLGLRESPVARLRETLDAARDAGNVRALLLRIHSPGGTVTASELMHREILRFKQETGVPVVASVLGQATSGGYYVAMAADHVIAHPTAITGSIGVILSGVSLAGLLDKLGIEDQTLASGAMKDASSPLRRMRPEERAWLESVLADLHVRFLDVVAAGRPGLERADVAALADGRIFSAPQALERGLIDAIGDLEDAVAEVERRAGLERSQVVVYRRPGEHRATLYASGPPAPRAAAVAGVAAEPPGFLYLWRPGIP